MKLWQDVEAAAHMWAYCIGFNGGVIAEAVGIVYDEVTGAVATAVFRHMAGDLSG